MRDNTVLCICCNQYITRHREREHRKKLATPYAQAGSRALPSRQRRIEHSESEPEHDTQPSNLPQGETVEAVDCDPCHDLDIEALDAATVMRERWDSRGPSRRADVDSEEEDLDGIPFEDEEGGCDESDAIDWDTITAGHGLSAWDRLGEKYEQNASEISQRLSEYDRAICRAFAYKVQTHTSDKAFKKIPYAFPTEVPLPKLDALRARVAFLAGFKPEIYHCCRNSCCCFTGPHEELVQCPYCRENRFQADGKTPRKTFTYIPLIPRLIAFSRSRAMATAMQYRAYEHEHKPGHVNDVFDGSHYRSLRTKHVKVDKKMFRHKYFSDTRDVALGLSTDGFAPFKRRKNTAWPLIVFNYNLSPDIRFHMEHILALGVVPGPKKPKDLDSFIWPFVREMLQLAFGVRAFDILRSELFALRAFLILIFGDIPALSLIMRMKGHNGFSPCRMCEILGVRVPGSRAATHYVPLDQSSHPMVQESTDRVAKYNPAKLPKRSHATFLAQAAEVDAATTNAQAEELAKQYGIKGTPLLSHLDSLEFPACFPYDFMHLIWENLIKNLVLHWTGEFKGLDSGKESYRLSSAIWEAIGEKTAAAGTTTPSAYGCRIPNIADRNYFSAEMWSFWTLYLGPILLRNRFQHIKYYRHFVRLVSLLHTCLQFEISSEEIQQVRQGFIQWVKDYENVYYQHDLARLPTCPLTIHALLHIADSIEFAGPVWCYWAFPMERYCGKLQPAIRSRRFPYASLDCYVTESSQLSQIGVVYDLVGELSLRPPKTTVLGVLSDPMYPGCLLLPPRLKERPSKYIKNIAAAVATRLKVGITTVNQHIRKAEIEEWGKVRMVDHQDGDTMHASSMRARRDDTRNASFVRYQVLGDKNARHKNLPEDLFGQTLYGELEHIYVVRFTAACPPLGIYEPTTLIFAGIKSCKLANDDPELTSLDIHFYSQQGAFDVVDIMTVQALVGRADGGLNGTWAIFDRSGSLARAVFVDDHDDDGLE